MKKVKSRKRIIRKTSLTSVHRIKGRVRAHKRVRRKSSMLMVLPSKKKVAVILSVINEAKTISPILDQLRRLALAEIIVVVNGSMDDTFSIVHRHPTNPTIIHYDAALGFDVGRAIGAKASQADILVFIDGDMVIRAEKLLPFIRAIDQGADIALNNLTSFMPGFRKRDAVSVVKEFLNRALGRSDLQANSLTAVPHALSRKACEVIGYRSIAIPPVAQAIAIQNGLKVVAPYSINVIQKNRVRAMNTGEGNVVEQLIIGDNLEALHTAMTHQGERLGMPDKARQRQTLGGISLAAN